MSQQGKAIRSIRQIACQLWDLAETRAGPIVHTFDHTRVRFIHDRSLDWLQVIVRFSLHCWSLDKGKEDVQADLELTQTNFD